MSSFFEIGSTSGGCIFGASAGGNIRMRNRLYC